jgi:hypothetical protein
MPTCPAGHESASTDYCDACGRRMGAPAGSSEAPAGPGRPLQPCPNCGTHRSGLFCETCGLDFRTGRLPGRAGPAAVHGAPTIPAPVIRQPASGHPASSHPAPRPLPAAAPPAAGASPDAPEGVRWSAVAGADRAYYQHVVAASGAEAAGIKFPEYCPERHYQLSAPQMRIGRVSPSRGYEPEIDLTGPPTDPGVSRLHAVLIPEADGTWAILDPGSENGTLVNSVEIPADQRVRLRDGDHIHLGAWTVLTIHATEAVD